MATILLDDDHVDPHVWRLRWVEKNEVIGRIIQDGTGRCKIFPDGPHWGPMKSFAAFSFDDAEVALAEVQLYFGAR